MRITAVLLPLVTIALLASCDAITGKEIARLPVNALSTAENSMVKEATLDLKKGSVIAFWSDMDLTYTEPLDLRFQVKMLLDTTLVWDAELDPFEKSITIGETRTQLGAEVNWRFFGKNQEFTVEENGRYTVRARLIASENPVLTMRKAELVIKQ